jgi:hypothetical protein
MIDLILAIASFMLLIIVAKFTLLFRNERSFKASKTYIFVMYKTFYKGFILILTGVIFDFAGEITSFFNMSIFAGVFFGLAYVTVFIGLFVIYRVMSGKRVPRYKIFGSE